ncbi:MAG TPA: Calx-beta domain-containing protein [Casimicrobiaceae bacterium]|nr:Calx-beta domain-containing protein [Casimicrobiaceae bacterium]
MKAANPARRSPADRWCSMALRRATRCALGPLLVAAVLLAPATQAQVLMALGNASVFEGNSGTTVLRLPVTLGGLNPTTVTGNASAVAISGTGFHPATAGASCGPGVDFISFSNVPFSIPPNTPNGTLNVGVTICPDATIEPDEQIFVFLSNVTGGAFCTSESCAAVGTIVNDDGPPSVSINDISTSEPAIVNSTRSVAFTVSVHHLFSQDVFVHFATRNGTAKICTQQLLNCGDYFSASGTVKIAANTLSSPVNVLIRGDGIQEPSETFFVDLSSPSPAGVTILDGTGQATIRDTTLTIGSFDLAPDAAVVTAGDTLAFDLVWTVPDGENWHDLKSIDFRIGEGQPVLWVRWDEATNTFSLCDKGGGESAGGTPVNCGPGEIVGSAVPLVTPSAQLILADTTVIGSGPTGPSVALHLVVAFGPDIKNHTYPVELSVTDDFDNVDKFVRATSVTLE